MVEREKARCSLSGLGSPLSDCQFLSQSSSHSEMGLLPRGLSMWVLSNVWCLLLPGMKLLAAGEGVESLGVLEALELVLTCSCLSLQWI